MVQKPLQLVVAGGLAEHGQSLDLELADAFPTELQLPADGLQRPRFVAVQPEARPQDGSFARWQGMQRVVQLYS
jgi:hypothetical protein